MAAGSRIARGRATAVLLAVMAIGAPTLYLASTQAPRSPALPAEGTVAGLHLQLDEAAIKSLRASPDAEVAGRLSVGAASTTPGAPASRTTTPGVPAPRTTTPGAPASRTTTPGAPAPRTARAPVPVTVRLKGQQGSKRSIDDKPALKIAVQNGQRIFGLENLTLNNMVQDPTMLHEVLGYRVYADAGVTVPDARYLRLTINGQPRGLYLLVETIDRQFLARRFGDASGILYEGAYGTDLREQHLNRFELDEGQDPGRAELQRLIRAVVKPGDGVFYGPGALVDTASFVSMMAVQVLIADWDNYYRANNYRIYWKPSARRWFFIPTGIDQAFSTTRRVTPFGGIGVLFVKCLKSERCRTDYIAAIRRVADQLERSNLPQQMERQAAAIEAVAAADAKKPYRADETRAARLAMRRIITSRPDLIRKEIARNEAPRSTPTKPLTAAAKKRSAR